MTRNQCYSTLPARGESKGLHSKAYAATLQHIRVLTTIMPASISGSRQLILLVLDDGTTTLSLIVLPCFWQETLMPGLEAEHVFA